MCENLFIVATQFVTKKQLKDLTHVLFLNPMSQII
jgi:hypothetical protein